MMTTAPAPAVTRPIDGSLVHRARRLYIDSGQEAVVYLHRDSQLCRSEGFESETRVWVRIGSRAILATLNVITDGLLAAPEVGVSASAWARLGAADGSTVGFAHPLVASAVDQSLQSPGLSAPSLEAVR